MSKCTAIGYADKPGLSIAELMEEVHVCKHYPKYWNSNVAFEEKWNKCLESRSAACKRIRHKTQQNN